MKTKIKNNPMAIIVTIFLTILMILCTTLPKSYGQKVQKTTVNVNFGFGPNYNISQNSFGYSSEVNAEFRAKYVGIEVGIGTYKNINNQNHTSLLKTADYLKIGPTWTKTIGFAECTSNIYLGYINSSEEETESLRIKNFAYGGFSEKIQFTFMTFDEGTLNLGFFAKIGIERTEKNNAISAVIGFAFKAIPKKR
ncbi:MAG: hypothetical protein WCH65_09075 [bacterium]